MGDNTHEPCRPIKSEYWELRVLETDRERTSYTEAARSIDLCCRLKTSEVEYLSIAEHGSCEK